MASGASVELPVAHGDSVVGTIRISLRRDQSNAVHLPKIQDHRGSSRDLGGAAPVQLLESEEYLYSLDLHAEYEDIWFDRRELFSADEDFRRGRLKTGLATGTVPVTVRAGDSTVGSFSFEVRSRKLDYERDYRWMLRDIAGACSAALLERFAPSEQQLTTDTGVEAATLYQRFAFLKSLLADHEVQSALRHITARPYVAWESNVERRPPDAGMRGSGANIRQLTRPGPRVRWETGPVEILPRRVEVLRNEATLDNLPNRFVKYAIAGWRNNVAQVLDRLETEGHGMAADRGRAEAADLLDQLDAFLAEELFREVGPLRQFPSANQVLEKKSGYRRVYRAFLECELAARLSWEGGDDVYGAGRRDVATLYEYWVFLQLASILADTCGVPFHYDRLFEESASGLDLALKQGSERMLEGMVERRGRPIHLELWYNRTFGRSGDGSWTRSMRPDCSLRLSTAGNYYDEPVWVHFDAKYRVEEIRGLFGAEDDLDDDDEAPVVLRRSKRADLLKMHAYRDAIHRSAGAYVVYPGEEERRYPQFHEILPGLGAFPLRPSTDQAAEGARELGTFLDELITHFSTQASQRERAAYWTKTSTRRRRADPGDTPWASFLRRPPSDSRVLLGFVRNRDHLKWIHDKGLYNLRGDDRTGTVGLDAPELTADFILLYGPSIDACELWAIDGTPVLHTRESLAETGYPAPRGRLYMCLPLSPSDLDDWGERVGYEAVQATVNRLNPDLPFGAPVSCSWEVFSRLVHDFNRSSGAV